MASSQGSFIVPQKVKSQSSMSATNPLAKRQSVRRDPGAESVRSAGTRKSGASSTFSAIKADLDVQLEYNAYYPGQIVRGTVRFVVRKPTKFYALRLRVAGKESMVVRKKRYASSILTKQRETFFKELVTLDGCTKTLQTLIGQKEKYRDQYLGSKRPNQGGDVNGTAPVHVAMPGEYTYPFEVQLPFDVPPSFEEMGDEEDYAAIIYYAKAYLDIPGGGESDLVARSFFRVVSLVGIKQWKADAKPLAHHQEFKVEGCCGSSQGFVKVSVEVPRRLLSIADDKMIPFRVVVNNTDGKVAINRIMIELVHVLSVTARGEEEERRTTIGSKIVSKTINPGANDGVIGNIPMPDDPPPSLTGLLFTSKYLLIIEADVPMAKDPASISEVTLVQRCETEEDVPPHPLGEPVTLAAVGLHEYEYRCPPNREADLKRIGLPEDAQLTGGSVLGMQMAADDSVEFDDALNLPMQHVNWSKAPKKRPLARWKLVPPADYRAPGAAGDDDEADGADGEVTSAPSGSGKTKSNKSRKSVVRME